MFNGKRERALEEALDQARDRNERRRRILWEICGQKENTTEQFTRLTASRAQIIQNIDRVEEELQQIAELSDHSTAAAGDVHSVMIEMNNAVESFDANHSVFVGQVKKQNEKVMEVVESNKHFTTPMKYISETPVFMRDDYHAMQEKVKQMQEYSRNMGVLALNAAIEAGRMGEAGSRFIASAEEIRAFSENYEKAAAELEAQVNASNQRVDALEEQVRHLNQLLKDNNILMGKVMKDGMMNLATYEAGQLELRSALPDTAVGKADALLQSEIEAAKIEEQIRNQVGYIRGELGEEKNCIEELENIYKKIQQSAEKETAN